MLYPLLLSALLVWSASSSELLLPEALEKGLVQADVHSLGGHTGKVVEFRITPTGKKKFSVRIPAGLILHSQDSTEQDILLVQERLLVLEERARTVQLNGYCIQASNRSPSAGSAFTVGSLAAGHLLTLAQHLRKQHAEDGRGQEAVWVLSDRHPLSYVSDPDLQRYLAELLGKDAPGYWIRHARQGEQGQQAFVEAPLSIEGYFQFQTEEPMEARLGLYDMEGTLLKELYDHGTLRDGGHRLRFTVELQNLDPGRYQVALRGHSGRELGRVEVEF
jgi:hypothetical protein